MSRNSFPDDRRESGLRSEFEPALRSAPEREIPARPCDWPNASRTAGPGSRLLRPEREKPQAIFLAGRAFFVRPSELQTMADLGTFRVVAAADLARFAYGDDRAGMELDLRRMKAAELLTDRGLPASGKRTLRVIALTRLGQRLMRAARRVGDDQALYHGVVKPREARHDAELYPIFHYEAARIREAGGRPLRVVLDYELKRMVNRKRARLGEKSADPGEIERVARECGLRVVDGKIPIPDLRIEYQTAEFELRSIDLELATRHYNRQGLAEKARAGFALFSPREDVSHLSRMLAKRQIGAGILAL